MSNTCACCNNIKLELIYITRNIPYSHINFLIITMLTKRLIQNLLITTFVLTAFSFNIQYVLAESSSSLDNSIHINKESRSQACEVATAKINQLTTRYDENKEKYVRRYNNIKDKIQTLIARLKDEGYDTTKLQFDLSKLDQQIKDFAEEYSQFILALNDAKTVKCGDSDGAFKLKLQEAKTHLVNSRRIAKEIHDFVKSEIKTDLQELKGQKPKSSENR